MANDIIDINVYETTETVAITVNPNLTTVNINQITSSSGGANLTTSQTSSNFTINSDTGTDASVPLGNGTLAGATLNDYTTAEKNKLVDTYTKGEVDTKITDSNYWTKTGNDIKNNNTGNVEISGTKTAVSNLAQGAIISTVLNSSANNDTLVGLDIKTTFNTGSFTGSSKRLFKITADNKLRTELRNDGTQFWFLNDGSGEVGYIQYGTPTGVPGIQFFNNTGTGRSDIKHITTGGIIIAPGTTSSIPTSRFWFYPTGNFGINQSTDAGYRLDVNGTTRLNGIVTATALVKYNSNLSSSYDDRTLVDKGYVNNTFVPYTGAVSDVNLGEFGIQLGNLEFDNTPTNIPTTAGSMYYNDSDGTLDLILKGGNVKLQIGQESVVRVVNKTSTNIDLLEANYQAVRVTGAQGQRLKVDLAQATNDVLSAETIGLVTETIANNAEGFITTSGLVRNINTTGSLQSETWLDGDVLYLSPTVAGRITKVKPIAPNHLVIIGYVISAHATQGTIFVKVDNGYELDELHNVKIDTATNNEVLAYTSATDIWENKTPSEAGIQPTLVSATNIKTINGNTLLGSGDLIISGTGISSLNGLTGATQTFSILTNFSGSPSFVSSGTNHQLRLPTASSGVDYGLVTNGSQNFGGTKIFVSNPEIPVPVGNTTSCIVLGSAGGGGATGTLQIGSTTLYPTALEMQYVKGVTSSVQTQLDSKASGLDVAEQTYSLSPTFTGTAPTIISSSTYQWNQVGTLVTGRVNLIYTTAGSISQVAIPLPADMPTPLSPTGLTGALDVLYYGVGMFNALTTSVATVGRTCLLRRNVTNTGYEFVITHSSAVSSRVISLTLQYFT